MNRKFVLALVLTLLIGMLYVAFKLQTAKASGIIYIRADGRVEGTTSIQTADNVTYVFTANINASIVVQRNNIIIDGKGHTLQGALSGTGIDLSARTKVTVQNATIKAFFYGIWLDCSSSNTVSGNNITANNDCGIWLRCSSNNMISGNNITANNGDGIWLGASSNNTLAGNIMTNNVYNFVVDGWALSDFVNDVDTSNTVDGKPVYYWVNRQDMTVPLNAGTVVLANCTRITVQNLNLAREYSGVLLAYTTNSTITRNNIANNGDGIYFWHSSNNSIYHNNITANNDDGIVLIYSSNNIISGNDITNNYFGIWLVSSSSNTVSGNNITANNGDGIWLFFSSNNMIYHNNLDNSQQVASVESMNVWDAGYPSGGNYWSDYNGTDIFRGIYQNETGSDGIGDTSYTIDTNNRDNYPLMKPYPWGAHDIGVTYIGKVWEIYFPPIILPLKTIVGLGFMLHINVFVMNHGAYSEVFNVTVYANTTAIDIITNITLASRNSVILNFTWNTTGFAKGNYTIWAYAWPVPDEIDTDDNTKVDGFVWIGVPCDVTGPIQGVPDGVCNMRDIGYICNHFGTKPSSLNWDPNCDVTGPTRGVPDGIVNMRDIGEACRNFGNKDP